VILDQTLPAPSISYSQARQQYDLPDSFYTLVQDYVVVQDGWRDPVMLNCQPTDSFVRNPMTSHHWLARSVSKCFKICRLESYQRLTQLLMHVSSLPASFPVVIELVMHFLKQISARECVSKKKRNASVSYLRIIFDASDMSIAPEIRRRGMRGEWTRGESYFSQSGSSAARSAEIPGVVVARWVRAAAGPPARC